MGDHGRLTGLSRVATRCQRREVAPGTGIEPDPFDVFVVCHRLSNAFSSRALAN